jgi:hypothetical protein
MKLFNDEKILREKNFTVRGKHVKPGMIVGCKINYKKDIFDNVMINDIIKKSTGQQTKTTKTSNTIR